MPENAQKRNLKTPMKVRAGQTFYYFAALEDVYNECLADYEFFDRLKEAVAVVTTAATDAERHRAKQQGKEQLADVLMSESLVLPNKCFDALFELLIYKDACDFLEKCLREGKTWEEMLALPAPPGPVKGDCHWPDCPDSKT